MHLHMKISLLHKQTSGQAIPVRWVTPHNFTQHVPDSVDFRVMLTFFEFYETLLSFVLFKLYGELGVRYPLPTQIVPAVESSNSSTSASTTTLLHPTLGGKATSVLAANLNSLQMALKEVAKGNSAADAVKEAIGEGENVVVDGENGEEKKISKASKKKQRKLMQSIDEALKGVQEDEDDDDGSENEEMEDDEDQMPIAAPLREALEAIDDSAMATNDDENNMNIITDPEALKRHQLFANLTFFLSREVPRGYLELIILSYGGSVGWEGQDSPIRMDDASITHHVIDRPKLLPNYSKLPKSREYIQPQWILDCANFNFILPIQKYGIGSALPPHLSPWVNDTEEGYVPKYKEEVERLKNGEVLEEDDEEEEDVVAEKKETDEASPSNEKDPAAKEEEDESDSESSEDEDDEEAERKAQKKKKSEVSDTYMQAI